MAGLRNNCNCERCAKRRIYQKNVYYRRTGQLDRIQPVDRVNNTHGCMCEWCVAYREQQKTYWQQRRAEYRRAKGLPTLIEKQTGIAFEVDAHYEWDRTTLYDYGPKAQERKIRKGWTNGRGESARLFAIPDEQTPVAASTEAREGAAAPPADEVVATPEEDAQTYQSTQPQLSSDLGSSLASD